MALKCAIEEDSSSLGDLRRAVCVCGGGLLTCLSTSFSSRPLIPAFMLSKNGGRGKGDRKKREGNWGGLGKEGGNEGKKGGGGEEGEGCDQQVMAAKARGQGGPMDTSLLISG